MAYGATRLPFFSFAIGLLFLSDSGSAIGQEKYTPNHPVVREMIRKALLFLEKREHYQLGESCLASLAFLNENVPKTHPKLMATLRDCETESGKAQVGGPSLLDTYNTALAAIFLANYDGTGQKELISKYAGSLMGRQNQDGAWGYPHSPTLSDTSQTQYALLAIWYAQYHNAHNVPSNVMPKALNWLMATQDPTGEWGYNGQAGTSGNRVPQIDKSHSLTAAGLSSAYVCANLLHMTLEGSALPEAVGPLRPVQRSDILDAKTKSNRGTTNGVSALRLRTCLADGNQWFDKNLKFDDTEWAHYYMYAYERYRSFREIAEGKYEASPKWYNLGVKFLRETQQSNGSWDGKTVAVGHDTALSVNTAFAVLFLQRNTQKALEPLRAGRLTGGRGLPKNLQEARVFDGKIQGRQFEGTMNELLAALDDPNFDKAVHAGGSHDLPPLSDDPSERKQQLERLRRMVAHDRHALRLAAVQMLARSKTLDEVPYLIYALTDPDTGVMLAAQEGLQTISRKTRGFQLPEQPTRADVLKLADAWKAWYRSLRPNATFLE
ncbi:MAG: hypothetical protein O2931_11850 [Planctomycetota bacterium]|nr:hypothetical protein [Planctomycetota bacterium]MDA1179480.1 hypothetical protein [Planctomycetota bacterium]